MYIQFSRADKEIICNGKHVSITTTELAIALYIAEKANQRISCTEMLIQLYGREAANTYKSRIIDIHINKLKKKIDALTNSDFIECITYGYYRMNVEGVDLSEFKNGTEKAKPKPPSNRGRKSGITMVKYDKAQYVPEQRVGLSSHNEKQKEILKELGLHHLIRH